MKNARILFICCCAILLYCNANATDLYVSTKGNDSNNGSQAKPFATITGAKNYIRTHLQPLTQAVTVNIESGDYYINAPVVFTPQDSGTDNCTITYRGSAANPALISAGVPVGKGWQKVAGQKYWKIALPQARGGNWVFRQLYADTTLLTRARYPNKGKFMFVTQDGDAKSITTDAPIKSSWGTEKDANISLVADREFFNEILSIKGVNKATGKIAVSGTEAQGKTVVDNQFFIEGVFDEMDAPGEWYLDSGQGILYLIPPNGQNPNEMNIVAPKETNILTFKGTPTSFVKDISIQNLRFAHTSYSLNHLVVRTVTEGALYLENAHNCVISHNQIYDTGSSGIWLNLSSWDNVIDNNEIFNMGGSGVLLTSAIAGFARPDQNISENVAGQDVSKLFPKRNKITNNHIFNGGRVRVYGAGIQLDSRPFSACYEEGNLLSGNTIYNIARCGIFGFKNQGGNIIENNTIHDVMLSVVDGGGIHLAQITPYTAKSYVCNNTIYNVFSPQITKADQDGGQPKLYKHSYGIYLDISSSNIDVSGNNISSCEWGSNELSGAFMVNRGREITLNNNTYAGKVRITDPLKGVVGVRNVNSRIQGNLQMQGMRKMSVRNSSIFQSWDALAGTGYVVDYSNTDCVTKTGSWKETTNGYLESAGGNVSVKFSPVLKAPGSYNVYMMWDKRAGNSKSINIAVKSASSQANVPLNEETDGPAKFTSGWFLIGKYNFNAQQGNGPQSVTLKDNSGATVSVQAIAFAPAN